MRITSASISPACWESQRNKVKTHAGTHRRQGCGKHQRPAYACYLTRSRWAAADFPSFVPPYGGPTLRNTHTNARSRPDWLLTPEPRFQVSVDFAHFTR